MRTYSKDKLIGKLVEFKKLNGHYPGFRDFENMDISPKPYYSKFGGLKKAYEVADKYAAGELEFVETKPKRKKVVQCVYCGNYGPDIDDYYSIFTNIVVTRFIKLLNTSCDQSYFNAVLDCIFQEWGGKNQAVRQELHKAGYLQQFEKYHNLQAEEEFKYKTRCSVCGKLKNDEDITVELIEKWWRPVCEECYLDYVRKAK